MKQFLRFLILPVVLVLLGGISLLEAKVCFIVDAKGDCGTGKIEKFSTDCAMKGYTLKCEEGHIGVGDSCGGLYKKCACDTSIYQYTGQTETKYAYRNSCTDDDGTYYQYKICTGYPFASEDDVKKINSQIEAKTPLEKVSVCPAGQILSEDVCEEVTLSNVKRAKSCVCDTEIYPYTQADAVSGAIAVGGETCRDTSGTHYKTLSCTGLYTGSCQSNDKGYIISVETSGDLTCRKCTPKTCADYEVNNRALQANSCGEGYRDDVYDRDLGDKSGKCHQCTPLECQDYEDADGNVLQSSSSCASGYTAKAETKKLGNQTGTCYRCEKNSSGGDVNPPAACPTFPAASCPSGKTCMYMTQSAYNNRSDNVKKNCVRQGPDKTVNGLQCLGMACQSGSGADLENLQVGPGGTGGGGLTPSRPIDDVIDSVGSI